MHSLLVRGQNVFGHFTTVASAVAAVIAVSVLLIPQAPSASLKLRNVQVAKGRPHYYSTKREEYAHVRFDLDTDLSSLFNWNTKQVFVYITATYPSKNATEPPSQAIVWDAILPSALAPWHHNQYIHPTPKPAAKNSRVVSRSGPVYSRTKRPGILKLSNQKPKYQITDHTGLLAERKDAQLELSWNIQPWVGALTWKKPDDFGRWKKLKGGKSKVFSFPEVLGKKPVDMNTVKGGEGNRGKPA
ncbi:signal peptidase 22 kDa subunit [Venturia nashicola]|uniref:Signal peptidase subunit 3 n=1 Tax=Venturia nashicola TaxID=86259 RepID=A0A4Z1PM22_9PEZI|nr:signal peptidase 22 kDa subunit [Venturia nashicola]TLD35938.1 signal peptidase 22 kDa subunit [Venturia nashicola]